MDSNEGFRFAVYLACSLVAACALAVLLAAGVLYRQCRKVTRGCSAAQPENEPTPLCRNTTAELFRRLEDEQCSGA